MTGRPEILFPLFADLETLDGVGPKTAKNFAGLHIQKPRDLLFTLPHSGIDRRKRSTILNADFPEVVTVEIEVGRHQPPNRRGRPYRVEVKDAETTFQLVFFHARDQWLNAQLPTGQRRVVSGKVELFDGIGQMPHPDHMVRVEEAASIPSFEPVYPLTAGITQKIMTRATSAVVTLIPDLEEWIDPGLRAQESWPTWKSAIETAHRPISVDEIAITTPARQRLAYDELFAHQLTLALARAAVRRGKGVTTVGDGTLQRKVLNSLPYTPTGAQTRAIDEVSNDISATKVLPAPTSPCNNRFIRSGCAMLARAKP